MNGNKLASDVEETYVVPVTNTPPVFETSAPTGTLTWCEGEMKGATSILLPKGKDTEGDSLTYSLSPELPNSPVDDGLYWETVDSETRYLRGKAKTSDAGTYTWTVTDEHGASNVTPLTFTIVVNPYKQPNPVTNVMAVKVDADAVVGDDVDKVKLTWTDPNPTTYPNADCIPMVTAYIVTMQKLNTHTQGRTAKGAAVSTEITIADGEPLAYTTSELEHGTYEFTVQAVNRVTRSDNTQFAGTSDASDEAIWDVTGYHWVIVNDPPKASTNLRANQTEQPAHSVTLDWIPPEHNPDAPVNDGAEGSE